MAALGLYDGENTAVEHVEEAARLGGADAHRVRMVNALLGAVQVEAPMADSAELDDGARYTAWEEQLTTADSGLLDDPCVRVEFIRRQVLRAGTLLRLMAQNPAAGPIPPAAAYAVTGLHTLLGVIAAGQAVVAPGDAATLAAQAGQLEAARGALQDAIDNTGPLLKMLKSAGL